jgi:HK97 family phage major capsid protein
MADIERALNTLVASTGNYLIPEAVDPGIRDYIWKATPLLNLVTRVPWPTNTYMFRKRTSRPSATWAADGGSLPAADVSTYGNVTVPVKYVYGRGEVTGPLMAAAGGVVNALQEEIRVQGEILAEDLTTKLVTGDSGSDPNEIDGMLVQIPASVPGDEGGTQTESATLTLSMLDEAIDATRGEGNVILTSRAVRRKINSLLQAQQRFNDMTEIGAGFRVLSYDGIPIITDLHWEDDNDIIIFRREDAKLLVNQDWTFSPLAKTKDSEDFFIKGYFGFSLEGRPVRLTGFALA